MGDKTGEFEDGEVTAERGVLSAPDDEWTFSYDPGQLSRKSSGIKRVYAGTFARRGSVRQVSARALVYMKNAADSFGTECANLSMLSSLGVGPKLLAIAQGSLGGEGVSAPIIVEEDVGQSLATLLDARATASSPLHEPGTPERALENAKIMYDIFVQVINAHAAGIYHRDLRCENVCVRRFGPAPVDLRATLVDFDLVSTFDAGVCGRRAPLYYTLFSEVPSFLGAQLSGTPTAMELDMAYLAALQYHVHTNSLALNGDAHDADVLRSFASYLADKVTYFGYVEHLCHPYVRELNVRFDVEQLADSIELVRVDETTFPSVQLRALAHTLKRPYLDAQDMAWLAESPEARIAASIDEIARAKFATYNAVKQKNQNSVDYERLEDQPPDFIRSTYEQSEHMITKVRALGYRIVPLSQADPDQAVQAFSANQIEALARLEHVRFIGERLAAGWKLDRSAERSDPVRKVSPALVPYDELPDEMRRYNLEEAREIIPLLRSIGLAVVRAS